MSNIIPTNSIMAAFFSPENLVLLAAVIPPLAWPFFPSRRMARISVDAVMVLTALAHFLLFGINFLMWLTGGEEPVCALHLGPWVVSIPILWFAPFCVPDFCADDKDQSLDTPPERKRGTEKADYINAAGYTYTIIAGITLVYPGGLVDIVCDTILPEAWMSTSFKFFVVYTAAFIVLMFVALFGAVLVVPALQTTFYHFGTRKFDFIPLLSEEEDEDEDKEKQMGNFAQFRQALPFVLLPVVGLLLIMAISGLAERTECQASSVAPPQETGV